MALFKNNLMKKPGKVALRKVLLKDLNAISLDGIKVIAFL